jgi:hypothetical protein
MCTSFVIHSDKTYIGMNFDISKRPIKLVLNNDHQLLVLQSEGGQFFPAFGLNESGTFMNLLMVDPTEEGKYRRGKNCVHIMKLFDEVISGRIGLSRLNEYLDRNTIVNVPGHSVHSMIAGVSRVTHIVEPGRQNIHMHTSHKNFTVLTNFPLSENDPTDYKLVQGPGNDRYIKACEVITEHKDNFDIRAGFNLLKETVQHSGDYPTQLSMMYIAEEQEVYFTLNGDFNKVFEFSFQTKEIRSNEGFTSQRSLPLTKKGVLLSELEGWGEELMK